MSDQLALIDMDGTVADLDAALRIELAALASPGEPEFQHGDEYPEWLENRRWMIMMQPGFWEELPEIPLGFQIVKHLEDWGFKTHVLTKGPSSKPRAWGEKLSWCRKHLPSSAVTVTEDKAQFYGRILVDDWKAYGMLWLGNRPRGLLIVPAQPWNVGAESWHPNVFRYTGTHPSRLDDVIQTVCCRESNQDLNLPWHRDDF